MIIKENHLRIISGPILTVYWIALFIATHIPMPQLPDLPEHSDKAMHFVAYAGLGFLFLLWRSMKGSISLSTILTASGIIAIYANIDA